MKIKANELKKRIEILGYSQQEFAEKCGISRQALGSWLNDDRNAKASNIKKIVDFLKCSMSDIAEIDDSTVHNFMNGKIEQNIPSSTPDTIRNTPELRECIKDAMLREGIRNASELNRRIGYDSVNSIERLLAGKLNWFPDVLSAVLDGLNIKHDDAPLSPAERMLLLPDGFFNDGAVLVRPLPVVAWANAASYLTSLTDSDCCTSCKWDPETTETIPVPVGIRKNTQVFRVTGLSMEPTINDNDIILAEQRFSFDEISDKKVVVVKFIDGGKYPDSIVCKRLRKFGKQLTLTSDNPNGRDFEIDPHDVDWLGVVVQLLSNRGL